MAEKPTSVRLDEEDLEKLKALAKSGERSVSGLMRYIIKDYLKRTSLKTSAPPKRKSAKTE